MNRIICSIILLFACSCSCWSQNLSELNGQEYVDLGLSVLWATKNIGACTEDESGDYFSWGETEPKSVYSMKNYKFGVWGNLSKYVNVTELEDRYDFEYGPIVDNLTLLEPIDDAATCNWGSPWRMPTNKEYIELVTECEWIWIERYNGKDVNGYIVRGKNGNHIFLPCVGVKTEDREYGVNQDGRYWTSTLSRNRFAHEMFFVDNMIDTNLNTCHRYEGRPVRPVVEISDVTTQR